MKCISCGKEQFEVIAGNTEFGEKRDVVRCVSCGLAFVNPLPSAEEINEFYAREYSLAYGRFGKSGALVKRIPLFRQCLTIVRFRERFRALAKRGIRLKGKNVLEIGSANGKFLDALRRKGANVFGVEPSEKEAQACWDKFAVSPIARNISALLPEQAGSYDLIFSFHVLEHLRDPVSELQNIKRLLKPGGWFIAEVPFTPSNVKLLDQALEKSVFDNLHLFHFNAQSASNLLNNAGFTEIEIRRLELKSAIRKVLPQANVHYLHPSFKRGRWVKMISLLQAAELGFRYLLGGLAIGEQKAAEPDSKWQGPNDWLRFYVRK